MERCPNCRARHDTGDTCRRCGMDLSLLLTLERAADRLLTDAVRQLVRGTLPDAVRTLEQACRLYPDPFATHLLRSMQELSYPPMTESPKGRPWVGPGPSADRQTGERS